MLLVFGRRDKGGSRTRSDFTALCYRTVILPWKWHRYHRWYGYETNGALVLLICGWYLKHAPDRLSAGLNVQTQVKLYSILLYSLLLPFGLSVTPKLFPLSSHCCGCRFHVHYHCSEALCSCWEYLPLQQKAGCSMALEVLRSVLSPPPELTIIYATWSNPECLGGDGPEFISSYYCSTESVWLEVLISSTKHIPLESINKLQVSFT